MYQNKLAKVYRSVKFEIKYFFKNSMYPRFLREYVKKKRNEFYKSKFNFILTRDYIKKFHTGEITENILDYGIDLFRFEDAGISCFGDCAFVHKFNGKEFYTLKESSGINKRVDKNDIIFGKPLNLHRDVINEDEICLACFPNGFNYWHFIFDIMPKIMIMEETGYKGKYLVNASGSPKEVLELLGFAAERIIFCERNKVIHAKKLLMFDESYGIELGGRWLEDTRNFVVKRIEERFGSLIDESSPKKLYVSRIGSRRIINENELIDYLRPYGFAIIVPEKLSLLEQIKLFANADIIVTPHGANATNVLYSKKGTTFVECFGHSWVNPCMVNTVDLLELDYHMICERFMHNLPQSGKNSNYIVDITIFKNRMARIFEYWNMKNTVKK
ncbi:TPA: glycosyltransferase family 61 protein [Candidatus Scatousia excrementigallinarum]|uniref:Glycosyltransferase family 61 protein n=1 Tax=Candidatus Scatousia excrementigallinarum TaxID=2840935 RepID=A0A9D1EY53_9BACT|nr:glycosyltransferase family 61 protein [Candidatus Scatousia excrementigallinarum]